MSASSPARFMQGLVILDKPGFPFTFELNPGDSMNFFRTYKGKSVRRIIKLLTVTTYSESNYWFRDAYSQKNYYSADIELEISGRRVKLHHRPYQMPEVVEGLRVYIENIKEWDEHGELGSTGKMERQVRIAVCLKDEPWGPEDITFPVNEYRWRSAVYNNTWSGLVPFNRLYYHRGEDWGAIPDMLEVVSPVDGRISATPLPAGDGESNYISIESPERMTFLFAHMDIETIPFDLTMGTSVRRGKVIGKTGMTWYGKKSQNSDPHLHIEITVGDVSVATFPYMMEAYLRKYSDKVVAIAGGYRSAIPGEAINLDATRSLTADGSLLRKYTWKMSDGRIVDDPEVSIKYAKPGIYCEELTVETRDGYRDKDFLYVIVYDPANGRKMPYGWAYYYPVRGIKTGSKVLFWNRLTGTASAVQINYGDDNLWYKITDETTHAYLTPGEYIVTLRSEGQANEPVTLKMVVYIDK